MIQVQPCDIGNEEVVARKKEEHYTNGYKTVGTISEAVKEKWNEDYVDQSHIKAPIIQIQI